MHNYVDTKRYIVCRFIMPAYGMQETHCTHPAADWSYKQEVQADGQLG